VNVVLPAGDGAFQLLGCPKIISGRSGGAARIRLGMAILTPVRWTARP